MSEQSSNGQAIEVPAADSELYQPPPEAVAGANVPNYLELRSEALADIEAYWDRRARDLIDWFEPYEKVLDDSGAPFFKWFVGGKTNIAYNALDRHVNSWRRHKLALIFEGEEGDKQNYSYYQLWQEVNKFANVLKGKGVGKGDTVTIYMGRTPELMIAMLAVTKIGAVHSVVYGGFSEQALASRIDDAQSRVLITSDGAWLRGKTVNLKEISDEAVKRSSIVDTVIVYQRTMQDVQMIPGRDHWWHEEMALPIASPVCESEPMDAEDPLFILYTSGTTGRPKGVLHTCGGYQVYTATTLKYVFDLKEDDLWWCAADPGWITGHSYIVYAPLILGSTGFMYEGAPDYPHPNRYWKLVEDYGITILYTAPTAIRGLMRFGDAWAEQHDLSSLRLLGSVGEPINPEAWRWYHRVIGRENCPIMDTWWQTETGGFMITPTPVVALKPGSATLPFTGIEADVVREDGSTCEPNEDGYLVIKRPWPGMARTVWGDPDRYVEQYWSEFAQQGWYFTGDSARRDDDGYFWIIGRMDDVIKVSGYRLGTAEIESALVSHPDVAEAACVGIPHELRGNVIHAFCILNDGVSGSSDLVDALKLHVRHEVGPIAVPAELNIVDGLPKTRSGKIMRRLLKAQVQGLPIGDVSTLAD
ncbi:MAG: acetate--CoA ligase [Caldilineaceae bacterium SB0661_bin_32]|uniref:Acetate--CoA ligase n=1 Tax=Caldilineaceae bacterium SB0661_bin_32 TaxID=2605255 RepID=A0A6B1D746_9CHLR|nr:acetate--CoA ligase [Caldilineaceae bacterium SB0661_bin_32]